MIKPAPRGSDPETIRAEILEKLAYSIGKDPAVAKRHDWLNATILALRDRIIDRWMESTKRAYQAFSVPSTPFRATVPLREGFNRIMVVARDNDKATTTEVIYVYRSPAEHAR